jgi:hypothetical protein
VREKLLYHLQRQNKTFSLQHSKPQRVFSGTARFKVYFNHR